MEVYELPFAKIIFIQENIAEVIINEGVEMDLVMVEQYHHFLLSHLKAPFSLLINKINTYTYNFEAQGKLADLDEIKAVAVIAYTWVTRITTKSLVAYPRKAKWDFEFFSDRDDAVDWLLSR